MSSIDRLQLILKGIQRALRHVLILLYLLIKKANFNYWPHKIILELQSIKLSLVKSIIIRYVLKLPKSILFSW